MMFHLLFLLVGVLVPSASAQTYNVVDGCIVGDLNAAETVAACAAEGLNCCTGTGTQACFWPRGPVRICEGSCNDGPGGHGWTCVGTPDVGKGSCNGHHACRFATGSSIGDRSCLGDNACEDRVEAVGDGSCTVSNACNGAGAGPVGDCVESCTETCANNQISVFNPSSQQCEAIYDVVDRCIVGDLNAIETVAACAAEGLNCCSGTGTQACFWPRGPVRICEGSCNDGPGGHGWTCVGTPDVGKGSCNGHHACRFATGSSIGDRSCIGDDACEDRVESVGDGSCTVSNACNGAGAGPVGDCIESCTGTCASSDTLVFDQDSQECKGTTAGAGGDPHFKSWSGEWFDFHGICDMVLVHSQEFGSGLGLDIHLRTKARYEYSYIEAAAIKIGDDILEVGSWGQYFLNGVDGATMPAMMGENFHVTYKVESMKKKHTFVIKTGNANGESIVVSSFKDMVSVTVENASGTNFGSSTGLMGNFMDGTLLARDGTTMDDHNLFGQNWQVLEWEPQLFLTPSERPYGACASPTASGRRRLGESFPEEAAQKACARYEDEEKRSMCVFDVMAMGDLEVAEVHGAF